jgi:hypothetical protein
MLATRAQALELSIVFSQSWARRRHRRAGQPADITQLLFGRALILQLSLVASDSSYLWDHCMEVSHGGRLCKRPCLA